MGCFVERGGKIKHVRGPVRRIGTGKSIQSILNDIPLGSAEDSWFYLLSDGLRDQKGPLNLPFGRKGGVTDLLAELSSKKLNVQHETIEERLYKFKESTPQTDDITIVGFSLKNTA